MAFVGPTANLPPRARRIGRSGTTWIDGAMRGEVTGVTWDTTIAQVPVAIAGAWKDSNKPGGEARVGTFSHQDVDDHFRRLVSNFLKARRNGDRAAAAQFPEFDIIVQIDDIGAPAVTRWALYGCQLYSYSGGYTNDDNVLGRDVPFTFEDDEPLDSFEYTGSGVVTYT